MPRDLPPVSVLVPVHGAPPGLERCLRSICDQLFPQFQVIFGLHHVEDPARGVIERLIAERPHRDLVLVVDPTMHGANPKNCNLANMYPRARHELLAIIDSDVLAGRSLLASMVAALLHEGAGASTCLYAACPIGRLPATLGALAINDWFLPSTLLHLRLRQLDRCYGAATLVRREALVRIGGFVGMASAVAQDYVLGAALRRAGYRLALAPEIVETTVTETGFAPLLRREQRWSRTLRAYQPVDHALSVVVHGLPIGAALCLLPTPTAVGVSALAGVLLLRTVQHYLLRRRLNLRQRPAPWLIPLRELLSCLVWLSTFWTSTIAWGARRLSVTGRLTVAVREP